MVEILKLHFGLETLYQFVLQLILLLFTRTSTPTTGGLESFFEKNTFFGIQFDPMVILSISAVWSLKTCILLHVKAVRVEKGFFRFKPTIIVFFWAFFGIIRRVGSLVAYFSPSLGLFSLLHHWQAENMPFTARLEMANFANNSNDIMNAKINLYNMTEEVSWSSLDRWNYDDPQHPLPPPYSMYTGLSLQHTFVWFIALFILQIFLLLGVKVQTSEAFRDKKDYFQKMAHLIQITNLPLPYQDWDIQKCDSKLQFTNRHKKTEIEMLSSFFVNFIITLITLIPLCTTGRNVFNTKLSKKVLK